MSVTTSRKSGETEMQFLWRLGQAKDNDLLDKTWGEIAEIMNNAFREPDEAYSESAYRKKYSTMKQGYEEVFKQKFEKDVDLSEEIVSLRREFEKEKVKYRDERNEYNRLIRQEARKEAYEEQFVNAIVEAAGTHPLDYDKNAKFTGILKNNTSLIASLSDIHAGIEINNSFNRFDEDILRFQLREYLDRIFEIQLRHGAEDISLIIGESVSGLIHPNLRIQNNQDLIDQFLMVTDYLADFIAELSYKFERVNVYVAPGNHGRLNPKKEESLEHENMDYLLIPFLRARLQNFDNVHCFNNREKSIAIFNVRGLSIYATHGDKDTPKSVTASFAKMFNEKPDIIWLGHRHYNSYTSDSDTKVIQSGCFCGVDEYAVSKRYTNKPEQIVAVITDEHGLDCLYDVKFD